MDRGWSSRTPAWWIACAALLACGDSTSPSESGASAWGTGHGATTGATAMTGDAGTDSDSRGSDSHGSDSDGGSTATDATEPTGTQTSDASTTSVDPTDGSTTGDPTTTSTTTSPATDTAESDTTGEPLCEPGDGPGVGRIEKSYLWVANSDQGSVSKVDTQTLLELARYRTGPEGPGEDPSRTAVSGDGRFVVINSRRTGRVTMVAANVEDCVDQDNDGLISTSQSPAELLPWSGDAWLDECVLWSRKLPILGTLGSGPRAVTWTLGTWNQERCAWEDPDVWIGYLPARPELAHMARLDGKTGAIEETVIIDDWLVGWSYYGPYGAALDGDQDVWMTGLRGELVRIHAEDSAIDRWLPPGNLQFYGMTVDPEGRPWMAGCTGPVSTFDRETETFHVVPDTSSCFRGVGADTIGHVWVADNGACGVLQVDAETREVVAHHPLLPCETPIGVSVDSEGYVWVVDEWIGAWKIDPTNPASKQLVEIDNQHYTYSDMTGGQIANIIIG